MSKEHQWKTINFLLVKPTDRSSIFFSKFISIVCLYFIFSFAIMLYAAIIGSVLYGFDFHTQPDLSYVNGQVVENSILPGIIYEYLINFLPYLFFASVAYFLSTVLKSSSISLLIGIVLLASSDVIATVLRTKAWSKFLPFMHTDLSVYSNGVNIANGMKIEFSFLILITYILIFLILASFVFKKRDIV
jgi:ABC-2 type transport system permease protein